MNRERERKSIFNLRKLIWTRGPMRKLFCHHEILRNCNGGAKRKAITFTSQCNQATAICKQAIMQFWQTFVVEPTNEENLERGTNRCMFLVIKMLGQGKATRVVLFYPGNIFV